MEKGRRQPVYPRAQQQAEGFWSDDLSKAWWAGAGGGSGQDGNSKRGLCEEQDQGSKAVQLL